MNAPPTREIRRSDAADWWRQAAVYQIYPRSFADSNGDGIGDVRGILTRVDYVDELGIDAVWLSPFYPSALADGGYDVADYRDVDPRLGTLADFDDLVAVLHARGIKMIVDIVPNHTSDQHAWFQEALAAGRGSAARERYIFRDGLGANGELAPTDWVSFFGGPAWQRVEDGQWYLHNFAVQQPDLNWSNPEVRADFVTTLRFWSDRGADGFRVDVAHMLTKDLSEPLPRPARSSPGSTRGGRMSCTSRVRAAGIASPISVRRDTRSTRTPTSCCVLLAASRTPPECCRARPPCGSGRSSVAERMFAYFDTSNERRRYARRAYDPRAVETRSQRRFVTHFQWK